MTSLVNEHILHKLSKIHRKTHKLAIFILIIGGINWGLVGGFNYNLVESISNYFKSPRLSSIIYIIVGISALMTLFNRDAMLPFLGDTAYPCSSLNDKVPDGATIQVPIKAPAGSKVVYWASEHSKDMEISEDPWTAYANYANTGVVTADEKGIAILKIREPTKYKVFHKLKTLDKHVHYRICRKKGILGRVETVYVK